MFWTICLLATVALAMLNIAGIILVSWWLVFAPVLFAIGWTLIIIALVAMMVMAKRG